MHGQQNIKLKHSIQALLCYRWQNGAINVILKQLFITLCLGSYEYSTLNRNNVARSLCPIPATFVIVGKLYSQFNKKLQDFLIAIYIAYCDNFTAKLRSVRPRQRVARTADTSVSSCQFAGPCRQWQEELVEGEGG
jgi:hypothetical protein